MNTNIVLPIEKRKLPLCLTHQGRKILCIKLKQTIYPIATASYIMKRKLSQKRPPMLAHQEATCFYKQIYILKEYTITLQIYQIDDLYNQLRIVYNLLKS